MEIKPPDKIFSRLADLMQSLPDMMMMAPEEIRKSIEKFLTEVHEHYKAQLEEMITPAKYMCKVVADGIPVDATSPHEGNPNRIILFIAADSEDDAITKAKSLTHRSRYTIVGMREI